MAKCREKAEGCEITYEAWTGNIQRQAVCKNPKCLISKGLKNKAKLDLNRARKQKAETRRQKEAAKTLKQLLADAQVYCNRYFMLLKAGRPCPTCGKVRDNMQAGHFIHAGSGANWPIRFHHENIWPQCVYCNMYRAGASALYREFIIRERGEPVVEYLENHPQYSFTREDAKDIKAHFQEEIKLLKKERG